jgi:hypothetical protein
MTHRLLRSSKSRKAETSHKVSRTGEYKEGEEDAIVIGLLLNNHELLLIIFWKLEAPDL